MQTLLRCAFAGVFGLWAVMGLAETDVVVGLPLEPPHLDPTSSPVAAIDQVLYANVFEGLTRFGPDGSVLPGLAESWQISEDGTVYLFKLRAGVTFHDGTTFEARDAKFTLDRARDETSQNAQKALFEGISEVEALEPLALRVTLSTPDGGFLANLAWGDAVVVAPESIAEIKEKPIGTGPFRFSLWEPGVQIELLRNPEYWGEPVQLDVATFRFFDGAAAAFAAVMTQAVDAFPGFPDLGGLADFQADPRFQVIVGTDEGETILAINNARAPFDNLQVRRAMAHAIDRQAVINAAAFGIATPIGTHFPPHNPAYIDLRDASPYDPALAIQLLSEAGFEGGFAATLKLPPPDYARRGGAVIAEQLRAVGISVEVIELDWPQWLDEVFRGKDFDLTMISHNEPFDIGIYAQPDYYFQYGRDVFQAIMQKLKTETDPEARAGWLAAAQRMLAEDYVNLFLFQQAHVTVADARLRGFWENAPIPATDLTGVYWEE